jgi:hypothetical protein
VQVPSDSQVLSHVQVSSDSQVLSHVQVSSDSQVEQVNTGIPRIIYDEDGFQLVRNGFKEIKPSNEMPKPMPMPMPMLRFSVLEEEENKNPKPQRISRHKKRKQQLKQAIIESSESSSSDNDSDDEHIANDDSSDSDCSNYSENTEATRKWWRDRLEAHRLGNAGITNTSAYQTNTMDSSDDEEEATPQDYDKLKSQLHEEIKQVESHMGLILPIFMQLRSRVDILEAEQKQNELLANTHMYQASHTKKKGGHAPNNKPTLEKAQSQFAKKKQNNSITISISEPSVDQSNTSLIKNHIQDEIMWTKAKLHSVKEGFLKTANMNMVKAIMGVYNALTSISSNNISNFTEFKKIMFEKMNKLPSDIVREHIPSNVRNLITNAVTITCGKQKKQIMLSQDAMSKTTLGAEVSNTEAIHPIVLLEKSKARIAAIKLSIEKFSIDDLMSGFVQKTHTPIVSEMALAAEKSALNQVADFVNGMNNMPKEQNQIDTLLAGLPANTNPRSVFNDEDDFM